MRIQCAKCNKPVDASHEFFDQAKSLHVIQAYCHDEMDQMTISFADVARTGHELMRQMLEEGGTAFQTERADGKSSSPAGQLQPSNKPARAGQLPHFVDRR